MPKRKNHNHNYHPRHAAGVTPELVNELVEKVQQEIEATAPEPESTVAETELLVFKQNEAPTPPVAKDPTHDPLHSDGVPVKADKGTPSAVEAFPDNPQAAYLAEVASKNASATLFAVITALLLAGALLLSVLANRNSDNATISAPGSFTVSEPSEQPAVNVDEPQEPQGTDESLLAVLATVPGVAINSDGEAAEPNDDALVTVHLFSDFSCPFCNQFEHTEGQNLLAAAGLDGVEFRFHPLAFLDVPGGRGFSNVAGAAFFAVAELFPTEAWAANLFLLENQGDHDASFTVPELADLLNGELGIHLTPADIERHLDRVQTDTATAAQELNVSFVPFVIIGGEQWSWGGETGNSTLVADVTAALERAQEASRQ